MHREDKSNDQKRARQSLSSTLSGRRKNRLSQNKPARAQTASLRDLRKNVPPLPLKFSPEEAIQELVDINRKVLKGIETLSHIREDDIRIGASAKEEVYREDKVVLYHYTPMVEKPFPIPLLFVYALVNRPL